MMVLALKKSDRELTLTRIANFNCIHTKIIAALSNALNSLLIAKVKHRLDANHNKGD